MILNECPIAQFHQARLHDPKYVFPNTEKFCCCAIKGHADLKPVNVARNTLEKGLKMINPLANIGKEVAISRWVRNPQLLNRDLIQILISALPAHNPAAWG